MSSYASKDGVALYIQGGETPEGPMSNQTFMIDLSVSWNTSSPAYKPLPLSVVQSGSPSALSVDGSKWMTLYVNLGYTYDTKSSSWSLPLNMTGVSGTYALKAVTDPTTGLIYVPFGFPNPGGNRSTLIMNLENNSFSSDNRTFVLPQQEGYALTWNEKLQKAVYYIDKGGYTFDPLTGWKELVTQGDFQYTQGGCLASMNGGANVVFFGGSINSTATDIFVLDVATLKWRRGPSVPMRDGRTTGACAVSNNQFIIWGGANRLNGAFSAPEHEALVYDLITDSWTQEYVPPGIERSTSSSTSTTVTDGSRLALIMGAVGGGLLVALIVGGIVVYRAYRKRRAKLTPPAAAAAAVTAVQQPEDYDKQHDQDQGNMKAKEIPPCPVNFAYGPSADVKAFNADISFNILSNSNHATLVRTPSRPRDPSFVPSLCPNDEAQVDRPKTYMNELSLPPKVPDDKPPIPPKPTGYRKSSIKVNDSSSLNPDNPPTSYMEAIPRQALPRRAGTVQLGPLGSQRESQHPHTCFDGFATGGAPMETCRLGTKPCQLQTAILMDGTVTDVLNMYCDMRSVWQTPAIAEANEEHIGEVAEVSAPIQGSPARSPCYIDIPQD
ncbi:hypothetical protein B0O80DRAFT_495068 [Mortierella sp. GBAus27b]|nr:hypothetical protein BGX31_003636 [Mortierella sp. GBA43]KAI8359546.1 hypothetical protein B0O80DRAFT_495068 [Mortierella sp. GBAus27b]